MTTALDLASAAPDGDPPADCPHFQHWPANLPKEIEIPETSLWFNLEVSAARFPRKAAMIFLGRETTFSALLQAAVALAGWLQAEGVGKGDRVALFLQNCPQFVIACCAILRVGGVIVPVNPMNLADEVGHILADAQPRVVICAADRAGIVAQANATFAAEERARVLAVRYSDEYPDAGATAWPTAMREWLVADPPLPGGVVRWEEAIDRARSPSTVISAPDDLALIAYTSGSTSRPKGCMHTHRTLMANAVGATRWYAYGAESVVLGAVPMFHISGMMFGLWVPLFCAATVVVMPRWDPDLAMHLIDRHGVTHWNCMPTMIVDLLARPDRLRASLSKLHVLAGGGATMPEAVSRRLQDEAGLDYMAGYGLTETAAPTHANPLERAKPQCLGIPFFGVDSRVVDLGTGQELPPGERGEIVTRGPMVFSGYWRQPEATAAAFLALGGHRYFRTGDLGYRDAEGYFFVTDRLKRMINASGFKVWPAEVELRLQSHPAIQEACVVGVPDARRGEMVKAVVVLREAARGRVAAEEIVDWARTRMAAYKIPRIVEFVDALPKSAAGKVLWRQIQERERERVPDMKAS